MGQRMANEKHDPYSSTAEDQPQKNKWTPDPGVSKVEAVMTV